jgi:hypothetical protein
MTSRLMAVLIAGAGIALCCSSPALAADAGGPLAGLPAGAAQAALAPTPTIPAPAGWPFPDAFSPTSGTGRLIDGALEWSDWVYDDYGASSPEGAPLNQITDNGPFSPAHGDYVYPSGSADNDGADIFRAAVGLTRKASVWRVDWTTLADPSIPIAEWTFDTDDNASTGASAWPADANVSSPGIEKALVVSSKGAELIDAVTGKTIATFPTDVDTAAQSFVVAIPRSVMPVRGSWRIRLGAGLADSTATSFAVPTLTGGASAPSSAPRVYNLTFRTVGQEPAIYTAGQSAGLGTALRGLLAASPVLGPLGADAATLLVTGNFWGEDDQAATLATGNVSKFSELVRWSQLADRRTTPIPLVHGYSDRVYVSSLSLGQGVDSTMDANPAYLSRLQPYAVYVPTGYTGRRPFPLTWLLHSLDVNYNQYGAIDPRQIQEECQDRDSICVSPEGFGADGGWAGDAEHDFWQVWRQMALGFNLDPERTVISGYSMGGIGSFELGLTYPSAFSESMPLDGLDDSSCSSTNRSPNARWEPFVISNAAADEESPWTDAESEWSDFQAAGNRYKFFTTTMPEHNVTAATDGFSTQIAALGGTPVATTDPGTISYTWCSSVVDPALGLGPTSVYWLSGLAQRSASSSSAISANDGAIPTAAETETEATSTVDPADAPPMVLVTGSWTPGATPAATRALTLGLTNVGTLTVNVTAARLPNGTATVTSDGTTQLTLTGLPPRAVVTDGTSSFKAAAGAATVPVASGTTLLSW